MGIDSRLNKLEREIHRTRVFYVIRSWQDKQETHDAIAQEMGYAAHLSLTSNFDDFIRAINRYSAMVEAGEIIVTQEFRRLKEETYRETAIGCVEDTYREWKDNLQMAYLTQEERIKQAYLSSRARAANHFLALFVSHGDYLEAAWSSMRQGKEMEAWLQEVEAEYSASELERWLEEQRQSFRQVIHDSDGPEEQVDGERATSPRGPQ